jgi:hypothetical protein
MTNPYREAGRVAEGERFIGRAALVRQVAETWRVPGRPSNMRVVGYHRVGKTSVVRHALDTLPPPDDVITVWLNVGSQDSGMDLYRSIVRRVLTATDGQSLDAVAGAIQAADQWYDLLEGVRTLFAQVRRMGLNVLVILDDFDRAAISFSRLAQFQLLRDLASEPDYSLGLITISRQDVEKIEIDAAGGSILGGVLSTTLPVGMFNDAEVDIMLGRSAQAGLALAAQRDKIMARTGPHPFLLESLCKRIVEIHELTGEVDVAEAFMRESTMFEAQFNNLLDAVNLDTESKGGTLLRELALGAVGVVASPDLMRLRLAGIVAGDSLFSAEFAKFLVRQTSPAVTRAKSG